MAYVALKLGATRSYSLPAALGIVAFDLVVSICLAWLLTRFVERPIVARWAIPKNRS
jgi:peptidoglycan/LPS O-acetylase OafA/YrhL